VLHQHAVLGRNQLLALAQIAAHGLANLEVALRVGVEGRDVLQE
jgi:hypothetical protein